METKLQGSVVKMQKMDVKMVKRPSVWKRNLGSELDPRKKGTRGDLGKDMTELSCPNKGVFFRFDIWYC